MSAVHFSAQFVGQGYPGGTHCSLSRLPAGATVFGSYDIDTISSAMGNTLPPRHPTLWLGVQRDYLVEAELDARQGHIANDIAGAAVPSTSGDGVLGKGMQLAGATILAASRVASKEDDIARRRRIRMICSTAGGAVCALGVAAGGFSELAVFLGGASIAAPFVVGRLFNLRPHLQPTYRELMSGWGETSAWKAYVDYVLRADRSRGKGRLLKEALARKGITLRSFRKDRRPLSARRQFISGEDVYDIFMDVTGSPEWSDYARTLWAFRAAGTVNMSSANPKVPARYFADLVQVLGADGALRRKRGAGAFLPLVHSCGAYMQAGVQHPVPAAALSSFLAEYYSIIGMQYASEVMAAAASYYLSGRMGSAYETHALLAGLRVRGDVVERAFVEGLHLYIAARLMAESPRIMVNGEAGMYRDYAVELAASAASMFEVLSRGEDGKPELAAASVIMRDRAQEAVAFITRASDRSAKG